jgi:hypothetical protein
VCPRDGDGERDREEEDVCLRFRARPRERDELAVEEGSKLGTVDFLVRRSSSPQWDMMTGMVGRSFESTGTWDMRWRTVSPERRWPKMVCLLLRWEESARVMKNLGRLALMHKLVVLRNILAAVCVFSSVRHTY